jgi:hypothetical protein
MSPTSRESGKSISGAQRHAARILRSVGSVRQKFYHQVNRRINAAKIQSGKAIHRSYFIYNVAPRRTRLNLL